MIENKVTLGIAIPTNEPEEFIKMVDSLDYLEEIKEISEFLINFQPPWDDEMIETQVSRIREKGFRVKYTFTSGWTKPIPIVEIRTLCAELNPDCEIYLVMDDDFVFKGPSAKMPKTSGQQYLEIVHYMVTHKKCGVVVTNGTLTRHPQKNFIGPVLHTNYGTYKGLFVRNMKDHGFLLVPNDARHLRGGLEESLLGACRFNLGYYPARVSNVRTVHNSTTNLETSGKNFVKRPGQPDELSSDHWLHIDVISNNIRGYIREHYNPNFQFPKIAPCTYAKYLEAGGLEVTSYKSNEYVEDEFFTKYENCDNNKLIKEINEI